ncbi:hypothetical protein ACOSQ2_020886 [Xanthoceras sorbifolium]
MASSTASLLLKNGKSIHKLLRNPFPCRPNPHVFQPLINPTTQELYLQRLVLWDGFDFVDFVRGKPSLAFDRMEAARGRKSMVSDGEEFEDEYGSEDEVKITDSDLENLLDSYDDSDEGEERRSRYDGSDDRDDDDGFKRRK